MIPWNDSKSSAAEVLQSTTKSTASMPSLPQNTVAKIDALAFGFEFCGRAHVVRHAEVVNHKKQP